MSFFVCLLGLFCFKDTRETNPLLSQAAASPPACRYLFSLSCVCLSTSNGFNSLRRQLYSLCVATRAFSSASQLPLASSSLLFLLTYFFLPHSCSEIAQHWCSPGLRMPDLLACLRSLLRESLISSSACGCKGACVGTQAGEKCVVEK